MANLNDFQEQLDILSATKTSIKEAIIGKGQEVSSEDSFSSYADKIDDIVTLEEGTADADAVASDIEIGKTAYVNGQKITGNIEKFKSISGHVSILDSDITGIGDATSALLFTTKAYSKSIIPGGNVHIYVYKSRIASQQELTADKLKVGETVLGITGTFTDDADATASDILYSKTAYVNGQKVAGRMMKHVGDSTYANQLSAPDNTDHFNMYYTSANDKIYIGNFKIGSGYWDGTASSNAYIDKNLVYTKLGLTANKLKVGESVLGVQGTFTSDATATNSDIASGKTAYVNGSKVVGVIVDKRNSGASIVGADVTGTNPYRVTITGTGSSTSEIINSSTSISCEIANNLLASGIGLTADKIKQGVTIIGITGTYTGSSMKEYASTTAMNNDIANISDGEVVKVDDGTTLDYYIKDTTMVKLIKESETISPQDFEEAEEQIGDLFGEEENN